MNKTWADLDDFCQGKAHIVAIVAWPRATQNTKYVNCDLQLFFKAGDRLFHHWDQFSQYGGYGVLGGDQFWLCNHIKLAQSKMNCEKQADLLNINEVRRSLKERAKRCFYGSQVTFDDNVLIRFAYRALINPWDVVENKWNSFEHQEFDFREETDGRWEFNGFKYGGEAEQWLTKIVKLPVLPFAYTTKASPDGKKTNAKMRWQNLADTIATCGFWERQKSMNLIKWAENKHLESKGKSTWTEKATVKAIAKAIKKAANAGRISTANARKWFQKFNAVSLLGDWARREKKALNTNNA